MRTQLALTGCMAIVWAVACSSDSKTNQTSSATSGGTSSSGGTLTGSTTGAANSSNTSDGTGGGTSTNASTASATGTADSGTTSTDATSTTAAGGATASTTTSSTSSTSATNTTGSAGSSTGLNCEPAEGTLPALGVETIADGFTEPLYVAQPPGDSERLFVVEQVGAIHIVEGGTTLPTPFLDIESQVSRTDNERGMLGLAFHPNFAANGLFYVHYSASAGTHDLDNGTTVLSEFVVSSDANVADPSSERVVLTVEQPDWNHNGGMITFGPNDNLFYMGLGDGGGGGDPQGNGQNVNTLLGKILRLDLDTRDAGEYGIPTGNLSSGSPEIWDYGLRNPWRFSFDGCTGDLYIADVGQNEYEEVNVEPAGVGNRNYGWNITEGLSCYGANTCDSTNLVEPVLDYGRGEGISVIGGYVYRGSAIPALRGTYLYADYQTGNFWAFEYANGAAANQRSITFVDRDFTPTGDQSAGVTSFGQDNAGEIYFTLRGGELIKIVPR